MRQARWCAVVRQRLQLAATARVQGRRLPAMGCASSIVAATAAKDSPVSNALEKRLVMAIISTKRRKSFKVGRWARGPGGPGRGGPA